MNTTEKKTISMFLFLISCVPLFFDLLERLVLRFGNERPGENQLKERHQRQKTEGDGPAQMAEHPGKKPDDQGVDGPLGEHGNRHRRSPDPVGKDFGKQRPEDRADAGGEKGGKRQDEQQDDGSREAVDDVGVCEKSQGDGHARGPDQVQGFAAVPVDRPQRHQGVCEGLP